MSSPIEIAVQTYLAAWSERDPALRATLVEACFAADGRIVTRGREIAGRAAFAEAIARFQANSRFVRLRLTSAIDEGHSTFRFSGVVEFGDGTTSVEAFDAGEIDASGRITMLITFDGPLRAATTDAALPE
jgi:hypothetical protein